MEIGFGLLAFGRFVPVCTYFFNLLGGLDGKNKKNNQLLKSLTLRLRTFHMSEGSTWNDLDVGGWDLDQNQVPG